MKWKQLLKYCKRYETHMLCQGKPVIILNPRYNDDLAEYMHNRWGDESMLFILSNNIAYDGYPLEDKYKKGYIYSYFINCDNIIFNGLEDDLSIILSLNRNVKTI